MNESLTPRKLARELGVSPKTVREVLRRRYGTLAERQLTRWELTREQADMVRAELGGRQGNGDNAQVRPASSA